MMSSYEMMKKEGKYHFISFNQTDEDPFWFFFFFLVDRNKFGSTKARGSESSRKDRIKSRPFPAPYAREQQQHHHQKPHHSSNVKNSPEDTDNVDYYNKHHKGSNLSKFSNSHSGKYHQLHNAESSCKKRENPPGKVSKTSSFYQIACLYMYVYTLICN